MSKKWMSWLGPILICILFIGLLLYHYLEKERALPTEDWSRTITVMDSTGKSKPYVYEEGNQFHLYQSDEQKVLHYVVNDLKVQKQESIQAQISSTSYFWAKEDQLLYFKDNTIFHNDGQTENILFEDVQGMKATPDQVVYWNDNEIYTIETESLESRLVAKSEFPIEDIILHNDPNAFIVLSDRASTDLKVHYFEKEADLYQPTKITEISEAGVAEYTGMDFVEQDGKLHLVFTTYSTAQQKLNYRAYYASIEPGSNQKPDFKEMLFHLEKTGERLFKPRDLEIYMKEDTPTVLFSTDGRTVGKQVASNIYMATIQNNKWVAKRISTSKESSEQPQPLNDGTVVWLDYTGKEYNLSGSSNNPEIVEQSQQITSDDWANATSNAISGLFTGFLILLIASIWIAPPAIFLVLVNFIKEESLDENKSWVLWASILIYLGIQLTLMPKVFNRSFFMNAPDYLTFSGTMYILPLVFALFAYGMMKAGTDQSWGIISRVSYFVGVNLLIFITLIGPYTI
ncbi:hypothetical protein ACSVDE_01750 [Pseudalkalibacillus sp. Hm43]|uniref:hypothetical protein n=1 Tax=Pseudalkalibacillus sp. Hm43 TaxID=3450742 RepID=UPI003F42EED9